MRGSAFTTTAYVSGFFCLNIALAMLVPMVVDLIDGNPDWQAFLASATIIGVLSLMLILATRQNIGSFSLRLGFLLVNALWVSTSISAAVPYVMTGQFNITDAVFESVSGLTTTGSTIIANVDVLPRGLLLWRSLTQWLGGIGILAMGLLLLPFLQIGGMQIYQLESSTQGENPYPRFAAFALAMIELYALLSLGCVLGYMAVGMPIFDAINHAMTTVSTGGFSTHSASLAYYGQKVLIVATVFMIGGAMPFAAMLRAVATRRFYGAYDPQIPGLLIILLVLSIGVVPGAINAEGQGFWHAFVQALFTVTSIVTTTGFASDDYTLWGPLAIGIIFLATFLGGAAGSTAGGFKTYRLLILYQTVKVSLSELIYPHGVFVVRYMGRQVPARTMRSVTIFFAAFMAVLMAATLGLTACGLDLITAFTGALTALCNVGPGLGQTIGPTGTFAPLPAAAKWILTFTMLAGRLEIMTMLVLVSPGFWRG